jgi:hypothetical protein
MAKTLQSTDGKPFELTEDQVKLSEYLVKQSDPVKLDFNSAVVEKVAEYLKLFETLKTEKEGKVPSVLESNDLKDDVGEENAKFIQNINDWELIFNIINCALILKLEHLHDLACAKVANFMKINSPEAVQKEFTIECQLTADEAKELGLEPDDQK